MTKKMEASFEHLIEHFAILMITDGILFRFSSNVNRPSERQKLMAKNTNQQAKAQRQKGQN